MSDMGGDGRIWEWRLPLSPITSLKCVGELFERGRSKALQTLYRDLERGRVDLDLLPILSLLNSSPNYYTTSSCSGRIQVASTRIPGEKFKMIVIAKWHRPISVQELEGLLRFAAYPDIWLSVQGPILHVACKTMKDAVKLVNMARDSGFKHSGIQGVGRTRVMVEVLSAERVEAPLRLNGVEALNSEILEEFVARINEVLLKGKSRLRRLATALEPVVPRDPPSDSA